MTHELTQTEHGEVSVNDIDQFGTSWVTGHELCIMEMANRYSSHLTERSLSRLMSPLNCQEAVTKFEYLGERAGIQLLDMSL